MILDIFFSVVIGIVSFVVLHNIADYSLSQSFYLTVVISLCSLLFFLIIHFLSQKLSVRSVIAIGISITVSMLIFFSLSQVVDSSGIPANLIIVSKVIGFCFLLSLGISFGIYKGEGGDYGHSFKRFSFTGSEIGEKPKIKILDTSVIIDGRISDIAEAGFLDGSVIVPEFIIKELQYIADSPDSTRRVRGKRGLDILKKMQSGIDGFSIKITNYDFPRIKEADLKLVELAKIMDAVIVTNDSNLNKVASIQNIRVLNLNELSSVLRSAVMSDDIIQIKLVKEGKDYHQAVGYLDDGTMVVVEEGRKHLGKEIQVTVKSVLQTSTGKMVFARIKEAALA